MAEPSLQEFQRNAAFTLFSVVITSAGLLFILEKLRTLLLPVIWAFFFATPILSFADEIETNITYYVSALMDCAFGEGRSGPVSFKHTPGQNSIYLDRHDESSAETTDALLQALSSRLSRRWRKAGSSRGLGALDIFGQVLVLLDRSCLSCFWGQRVRIKGLECQGGGDSSRHTNPQEEELGGLLQGRSYFASSEVLAGGLLDAEATSVELHLFLDRHHKYPAVIEDDEREPGNGKLRGLLEVDQRSLLSWLLSISIALCLCILLALMFVHLIRVGALGVQDHLSDYQKGVTDMVDAIKKAAPPWLTRTIDWDKVQSEGQERLQSFGASFAKVSLELVEGFAGQMFLFFLYLIFWVVEPLPINDPIAKVFKDYLALKTIVCLLFAGIMATTLACLHCPLWPLYFIITFLLNYIPEIGPILAGILMLPAVFLDGGVTRSARYWHGAVLAITGICAKILTGNIIEVHLYSSFGGEFMRIHPVVLFLFFTFCGYQLGTTGMFISIPILGAIKYSLVSRALPDQYLSPLLIMIEGDIWAPHRNRLERKKAARAGRDRYGSGFFMELTTT